MSLHSFSVACASGHTLSSSKQVAWTAVPQQLQKQQLDVHTAATYHLGPIVFSSKKNAKWTAQRLLREAKQTGCLEQPIRAGDEGFEYLWHLWQHHYAVHDHAHQGISHFSIGEQTDGLWPTTCFWVHFADGYSRDFSFLKCLDNQQHKQVTAQGGWTGPAAPRTAAELAQANQEAQAFARVLQEQQEQHRDCLLPDAYYDRDMRRAVEQHIVDFKEEFFNATAPFLCPITGEVVSKKQDCHVDHHEPPFAVLADQWRAKQGLSLTERHGWKGRWNAEAMLAWEQYHRKHARLRLVSKKGNLKTSRAAKDARATARANSSAEPDAPVHPSAAAGEPAGHASSSTSASAGAVVEPSTPKRRPGRPRKVMQEQQDPVGASSSTHVQDAAVGGSISAASTAGGTAN